MFLTQRTILCFHHPLRQLQRLLPSTRLMVSIGEIVRRAQGIGVLLAHCPFLYFQQALYQLQYVLFSNRLGVTNSEMVH